MAGDVTRAGATGASGAAGWREGVRAEQGSATLLMIAIVQVLTVAALLGWVCVLAALDRQRVAGAADLSALAGAQVLIEPVPGTVVDAHAWRQSTACGRAGTIAAANGARLASCTIEGSDLIVAVARESTPLVARVLGVLGHPGGVVRETARAGW